jgi:hypothetical protein
VGKWGLEKRRGQGRPSLRKKALGSMGSGKRKRTWFRFRERTGLTPIEARRSLTSPKARSLSWKPLSERGRLRGREATPRR